jgi:voltage-gated potassium channel
MIEKDDFFYLVIAKLRFPIILMLSVYLISVLGLVFIDGIDNNGNVYNLSVFDAIFITIYTSTTVGFGEIPYPWTDNQKAWIAMITIFSVISWFYSIGKIITIVQDKSIMRERDIYSFSKRINKINDDFYIICGFGETGKNLAKLMVKHGANIVIIDSDKDSLDKLRLHSFSRKVISIYGDISKIKFLKLIGIEKKNCKAIIITTNDEESNLKASISVKIINPSLKIISRVSSFEGYKNMKSYGVDKIINPQYIFVDNINKMMEDSYQFKIEQYLTSETFDSDNLVLNDKTWLIIGYKKYARNLYRSLKGKEGIDVKVIDPDFSEKMLENNKSFINGEGVDNVDLIECGINEVDVIVATNKSDYLNLSSLITARKINPNIKTIAIVNEINNKELFEKINTDYIYQSYESMVRKMFSIISEPLLETYFNNIKDLSPKDKKEMFHEVISIKGNAILWSILISKEETPIIYEEIMKDEEIKLKDVVFNDKYYKLNTIPLIIEKNNGVIELLDINSNLLLGANDKILFLGNSKTKNKMEWVIRNRKIYEQNKNIRI